MIYTVCSGTVEKWKSRKAAMTEFLEGMMACDGSEAERYTSIYCDLAEGSPVGWDGLYFESAKKYIDMRNKFFGEESE